MLPLKVTCLILPCLSLLSLLGGEVGLIYSSYYRMGSGHRCTRLMFTEQLVRARVVLGRVMHRESVVEVYKPCWSLALIPSTR